MSKSKYEIVPLGRAAKQRAAERVLAAERAAAEAAAEERRRAASVPLVEPVFGEAAPVGYIWVGRELVRIGRDDTKGYAQQRLVSPFGRTGDN
jgi:hypothetical protein